MYKRVAQIERIEEWCGCESVRVGEREGGGGHLPATRSQGI